MGKRIEKTGVIGKEKGGNVKKKKEKEKKGTDRISSLFPFFLFLSFFFCSKYILF